MQKKIQNHSLFRTENISAGMQGIFRLHKHNEGVSKSEGGFLTREKTQRDTSHLVFSRVRKPNTTRCVFPLPISTHHLGC